jgi:hypothetical protein
LPLGAHCGLLLRSQSRLGVIAVGWMERLLVCELVLCRLVELLVSLRWHSLNVHIRSHRLETALCHLLWTLVVLLHEWILSLLLLHVGRVILLVEV